MRILLFLLFAAVLELLLLLLLTLHLLHIEEEAQLFHTHFIHGCHLLNDEVLMDRPLGDGGRKLGAFDAIPQSEVFQILLSKK